MSTKALVVSFNEDRVPNEDYIVGIASQPISSVLYYRGEDFDDVSAMIAKVEPIETFFTASAPDNILSGISGKIINSFPVGALK